MQLSQSPKFNSNYAAKIIEIKEFTKHPNPKCERLKCCKVDGYQISVSLDTEPGTYIYFPMECQINSDYLSANGLFRDKTMNVDQTQQGFFEDNGRVKAIKLQGVPSEGFVMPTDSLYAWLDITGHKSEVLTLKTGVDFDMVGDMRLCKKYVVQSVSKQQGQPGSRVSRKVKKECLVIPEQFRFHYDTTLIKKCPYVIRPESLISITCKVHGTSAISSYVLCKKINPWHSRFAAWCWRHLWNPIINLKPSNHWVFTLNDQDYHSTWASRSVIKDSEVNPNIGEGYYGGADDHDRKMIHETVVAPKLDKGMSVYYEIIGYWSNGAPIQKAGEVFDYGFEYPEEVDGKRPYEYGKHVGIQVYRVTYTNPDGVVYEFSAKQVQQWCERVGLPAVKEYYYGYAKDLYPDLSITEHWNENFISRLASDKNFFMEELSPDCINKVPHEGVVIKIENFKSEAYKLKCFRFLEKESKAMDKGEVDVESLS